MKLRALRIHGFKSFADRTEVLFHDGITAVVGPNGCGKSNISDAIRWVLGEQRASAIRGARMEEAIFQGTVNRRPVNRGSVSLEVTNEDGALPIPYSEVEISRTVYRDGGSEYLLNRAPCRLKDIQDLYRDTGLGANAYSIIENRMIDAILSDRTDDRRALFEEAAGIGKYKDRRKATSRRLERAEVDLQRLEDLMGEIESKVRSLSRQKGKAERWAELRKERLDLEVSLARQQIEGWTARQREIEAQLVADRSGAPVRSSGIEVAEARLETLKLERIKLERRRSEAAQLLDGVRAELGRWERELAVAQERTGNAEQRLGRIHGEREEARTRVEEAETGTARLSVEVESVEARALALQDQLRAAREATTRLRGELGTAREALDAVEVRLRNVARRRAELGGSHESTRRRLELLHNRIRLLEEEGDQARKELLEMDEQGDLFSDRLRALSRSDEEARAQVEAALTALGPLRVALEAARAREIAVREAAATQSGRLKALERLEADREGVDPVVKGLLAAGLSGVHGILLDSIEAEGVRAGLVERYLGGLARAVVVEDLAAAEGVVKWYGARGSEGGGLVLLPLDSIPPSNEAEGSLLSGLRLQGPGAPWARHLLLGASLEGSDTLPRSAGVTPGGWVRELRGILRVGNPEGVTGVLERRETLRLLREALAGSETEGTAALEARVRCEEALSAGEAHLEAMRSALRGSEDAHREAQAEDVARKHRRERLLRASDEVRIQLEGARAEELQIREQTSAAATETEGLEAEAARIEGERTGVMGQVSEAEAAWDRARTDLSALEVEEARLRAEGVRLRERATDLGRMRDAAVERLAALDVEERTLREQVEKAVETRREGDGALKALFERRDEGESVLRTLDEAWSALELQFEAGEAAVREARTEERSAAERRHQLELEAGEIAGRLGRIQERLEGEWGRPLAELLEAGASVEGDEESLRLRGIELGQALERLGPVNQLAVEEHEEESQRLAFLRGQHDDLVRARNDLRAAIREINQTATRLFHETFEKIRENFRATFLRLFQGGECDLWLEDPEDPLDSPIEILASPRGKRTQRIDLLSGGERALTALSLLFGIYLVKPSPFCVLDEVDAPLDESNIGRFIQLLQDFKADTQFVVITHNPRTIEAADWIYGVTMEEPGVSQIVGVRLEDALEVAGITP